LKILKKNCGYLVPTKKHLEQKDQLGTRFVHVSTEAEIVNPVGIGHVRYSLGKEFKSVGHVHYNHGKEFKWVGHVHYSLGKEFKWVGHVHYSLGKEFKSVGHVHYRLVKSYCY
jgi:hypothetical protein